MAKKKEDGEGGEPGRDGIMGGRGTSHHADGVQAGEDDDIHQHDAFQRKRIGQGGDEIEQQVNEKCSRQPGGGYQGKGQHRKRDAETGGHGEITGGKGSLALVQMGPVLLQVKQVVENVGGRRREAKTEEGHAGCEYRGSMQGVGQQ
jgi:hypothetical protein